MYKPGEYVYIAYNALYALGGPNKDEWRLWKADGSEPAKTRITKVTTTEYEDGITEVTFSFADEIFAARDPRQGCRSSDDACCVPFKNLSMAEDFIELKNKRGRK